MLPCRLLLLPYKLLLLVVPPGSNRAAPLAPRLPQIERIRTLSECAQQLTAAHDKDAGRLLSQVSFFLCIEHLLLLLLLLLLLPAAVCVRVGAEVSLWPACSAR